ncbi:hypothetical protein DRO61_00920 [Candidatus Bathyarchaeota archaeon]|nr:MAG: hypothetical protein DRO61_00920 [Candidatus Bathyarchaeota archaeon]
MKIEHSSEYFKEKLPWPFEHEGFGRMGITDSELVMMTPEAYFVKVVELGTHTKEDVYPSDKEQIKAMMLSAQDMIYSETDPLYSDKWDIPYITIDTSSEGKNNQDGRHRVAAMNEMGIKEIPVFIFHKTKEEMIQDAEGIMLKDEKVMYYGTKLSENMSLDNNGFLICRNVPMARTGVQEYYGHELVAIGITDPAEANEIYYLERATEDVFDPVSMATWETATFTNGHPDENVSPENYKELSEGEIRRPRKASKPDENGDEILLVDIVIKNKETIEDVQNGKRDVSGGYKSRLEWIDKAARRLKQTMIRGNHVALVGAGRAGTARIEDSICGHGIMILDTDLIGIISDNDLIEHKKEIRGGDVMANEHKFVRKVDGKVVNTYVVEGITNLEDAKKVAIEAIKEFEKKKEA